MNRKKHLKKAKNRNGEGSWSFVESRNLHRYDFTYTNELGFSKRKTVYGHSQKECITKRDEFFKKNILYSNTKFDNANISNILLYLYTKDHNDNNVKDSTFIRNEYTVQIIESSKLGNMKIYDIKDKDIVSFLSQQTHRADSTISKIYQALNKAFKIAVYYELINKNPMDSPIVQKPKSNKNKKDVKALTIEEENRLLQELKKYKKQKNRNYYAPQILISLFSGMRIGEINALQVSDIDFMNNKIKITKTVTQDQSRKGTKIGNSPKTESSNRTIPIPSILTNVFKEAIENRIPNEYDLIFYDVKGKIINDSQVNSAYQRIAKRAGITETNFHALRHTCATRLYENKVDIKVVQDLLGHSDATITLGIYIDSTSEEHINSNMEIINRANEKFEI